jgi:predicted enzyme related to lactoylglutathione lyase
VTVALPDEWLPIGARNGVAMITGAHFLLYSEDAEADRQFFRDVLDWPFVDAGDNWLIFRLPPAEMGVHPSDGKLTERHARHRMAGTMLYLMCDDVQATRKQLARRRVKCRRAQKAPWGLAATVRLPSGAEIGLYQPTHPTAVTAKRRQPGATRKGRSKVVRG